MSEGNSQPRLFRFGMFELDSVTGELRKDGKSRPRIRDQALQILIMLLEKSDDVVGRDELRERLWPSDTFVDFDHGLNTAINQVRTALGDSAANPKFIQTMPRRGYRFIAPVQIVGRERAVAGGAENLDKTIDGPEQPAEVLATDANRAFFDTERSEGSAGSAQGVGADPFFADSTHVSDLLYYFPGAAFLR